MSFPDEPLLAPDADGRHIEDGHRQEDIAARIKKLVLGRPFAVLCTQGDGQPYGSLVAYAMQDDLRFASFATPTATRKYRLLTECDHIALLIDNRPEFPEEMMKVEAVTATGRATLIERGEEFERWAALLTGRHPYLSHFVRSSSCGLFRVEIVRYLHVSRFQEVRQWIPGSTG
ncbi:MAG: pyridoxamine 5'-phosphate oxidase family protein [Pirellulales bacterium]|nr:pyridoxamine 5'-phosphate oxidase family protein [Pirellulales bacterium]